MSAPRGICVIGTAAKGCSTSPRHRSAPGWYAPSDVMTPPPGVLDVEVEVAFKRRVYGAIRRTARRRLRLVAVRLPESSDYRFYLTNIAPESLDAHTVAQTYAARWQIELIFKELKSHYRLEELPTRKAHIVETLLLGAVITLLVSRRLLQRRAGTIATHAVQDARTALGCDLCRRRTSDPRYRCAAAEGIEGDCPSPRIDAAPRGTGPESVAVTAHRTCRMWSHMGIMLCNSTRAGWPWVVAHPRLPQIRACPTRAPGSSNDGFTTQRYTL